jgi:xanthine/CO dehydrogenase XdhC/CoxF family maturation factor
LNAIELIRFYEVRRERGEPLVLVTIFETQGSTYSKAGAQMLIDGDAVFHGMLSGGCLEGDLAIRAATVIETGVPQVVAYDLAQDDELWGLGVGCDGQMRVFLQLISKEADLINLRGLR